MHDIKRSVFEMPVKIHSENVSWGGTYNLVLDKERGLEISIYDIKAGKLSTEKLHTVPVLERTRFWQHGGGGEPIFPLDTKNRLNQPEKARH